ncbi:MAG: hypothetical protein EBX06_10295 [Rhodobacteraceae bacterium]|nr:hypothetical protein [Paracoccaceae bacterium]NCV29393.1 hypothetical protein [Paracoccaceae bacterium]NCV68099.1 hypothetical protein [Paracoccaceae bacterium]NCW03465.1 hypothetical protein [Paracoccaceae bacterium]NCW61674.1 hypothetical protein [Paracoccaceae bacterium]
MLVLLYKFWAMCGLDHHYVGGAADVFSNARNRNVTHCRIDHRKAPFKQRTQHSANGVNFPRFLDHLRGNR